jgi:hypothetical protein
MGGAPVPGWSRVYVVLDAGGVSMTNRIRWALLIPIMFAAAAVVSPLLSGQAWQPPKTAHGEPDLQGIWVNFDATPFEAPDPALPARGGGGGGGADRKPLVPPRRSMVVDPPSGRVPLMAWADKQRIDNIARSRDHWEYITPWERCITRGIPGGIFPGGYGAGYEIVQSPGIVAILYEMIHEPRIITTDGRPHLPATMRFWNGDSRGRWEGNTLVVDIANYNSKGSISTNIASGRMRGVPQSEQLHVVERFTPVGPNTINYEVTVEDPKVYDAPWKIAMPITRDNTYEIFEYACHEGNVGYMETVLGAGRAEDRQREEAAKKK